MTVEELLTLVQALEARVQILELTLLPRLVSPVYDNPTPFPSSANFSISTAPNVVSEPGIRGLGPGILDPDLPSP